MFGRLLADPTVAFNCHSGALPFFITIFGFLIGPRKVYIDYERSPCITDSLDSSSYGSVLSLTIFTRLSTITY
jgi:hypothetical protein